MLIRILSQYLRSHKRLVIPQLGVFLVKDPGRTVLFSELVRRDDGVLHGLLVEAGQSDLAAAGEIDRFVFEVRHAVERGESCSMPGLGVWRPGPHGTIAFEYRPAPEPGEPAHPAGSHGGRELRTEGRTARSEEHSAEERRSGERPAGEHAAGERRFGGHAAGMRSAAGTDAPAEPATPAADEADEQHLSVSAKRNPAPYVKGLNYGRPPRNTDAFTYVDKPVRRSPDRFVLAAIAALVIAICAIAYGYYHDLEERRAADRMIEMLEQAAQTDGETPDAEEAH